MTPTNVLFICSDQHARNALGCHGHPQVRTPHLDALAAAGTRFTAAYSSSPTCGPVRVSIASGRILLAGCDACSIARRGKPEPGTLGDDSIRVPP